PNGDCLPVAAEDARCWACHESGGLNMKEINSPWFSWGVDTKIHSSDGATGGAGGDPTKQGPMVRFANQLGTEEGGASMEGRTEQGNTMWNKKRVELLEQQGVIEVVRPLFCTLTINLQAQGSANGTSAIDGEFFVSTTPESLFGFPQTPSSFGFK